MRYEVRIFIEIQMSRVSLSWDGANSVQCLTTYASHPVPSIVYVREYFWETSRANIAHENEEFELISQLADSKLNTRNMESCMFTIRCIQQTS